ncbi:MAG: zf-HC2 domain-containing protein [Bryobacter sp.]|nr:zf-HC2 domain-containing protein [Bryobacter sp.]
MDHQEAARQQLIERYTLDELPTVQRDEFEAHLFECAQCSEALRAAAILQDNARTVFRAEVDRPQGARAAVERQRAGGGAPGRRRWFDSWFEMPAAGAAMAAMVLLGVVSYQNIVQIPRLRMDLESAAAPKVAPAFTLLPVTRGDELILKAPAGARSMMVTFDLTTVSAEGYICAFTDAAGQEWLKLEAPHPAGEEMLTLQLDPARIPPGRNMLTVRDRVGRELSRYRFTFKP